MRREETGGTPSSQPLSLSLTPHVLTQCGPNGCPNGGCPKEQIARTVRSESTSCLRVLGSASPNQGGPWPSLTPQAKVDLAPLDSKLERIADLLADMKRPADSPSVAAGPDAATAEMLQRHGQAIEQLRSDVPRQINAAVEPVADAVKKVGRSVEETNENIAKHGTLLERFAADKAKVAAEEPGASRLKQDFDAVEMDLSNHKAIFFTILGVAALALSWPFTRICKRAARPTRCRRRSTR